MEFVFFFLTYFTLYNRLQMMRFCHFSLKCLPALQADFEGQGCLLTSPQKYGKNLSFLLTLPLPSFNLGKGYNF